MLIFRECTQALPSILENTLWVRYRDNFLVVLALSEAEDKNVHVDGMFDAFKLLTGMEVTLEQVADEIEFLDCTLRNPLGDCPISGSAVQRVQVHTNSGAKNAQPYGTQCKAGTDIHDSK